ncbi:MAG: sortase [Chloroflexota bacterium]|nr:MAG: sortase [Chloroflexota bacterium]
MSEAEKQIPLRRTAFSWISYVLTGVGIVILLGTAGLYAYGAYEQRQFELSVLEFRKQVAERQSQQQPLQQAPVESPSTIPAEAGAPIQPIQLLPVVPMPVLALDPERVVIPSIQVDSPVVFAKIENGEWTVPKFVAGHLEGTAKPGENGNMVLSGHVQSISSGNVFAHLKDMALGDQVIVYTQEERFLYEVSEIKTVKNTDLSVVQPTREPVVTLLTCTGTWLPLARDYSERLIVVGKLTGVEPLRTRE